MTEKCKFMLTLKENLELAEKSVVDKNGEKCVFYLREALKIEESSVIASIMLAETYNIFGATEYSYPVLFKALSYHPSDADAKLIYAELAKIFFWLEDEDAENFYLWKLQDEEEIDEEDAAETLNDEIDEMFCDSDFYIASKPNDEEYSKMIVEEARSFLNEDKFDDVINVLDGVTLVPKYREEASQLMLVSYMMKKDTDRAINIALDMLKRYGKKLTVQCTLATAYLFEERNDDAKNVLNGLLQTEYSSILDIRMFLPILVKLDMYEAIKKYAEVLLKMMPLQSDCLLWLSQAQYNLGEKRVAIKTVTKLMNVFPENVVAKYFLELYKSDPANVHCSLGLPQQEIVERYQKIETIWKLNDLAFKKMYRQDKGVRDLIAWSIDEGISMAVFQSVLQLRTLKIEEFDHVLRKQLISKSMSIDVLPEMMYALLNNGLSLECDVVVDNKFKSIRLQLPQGFYQMPRVLRDAIWYAMCNLVYFEDDHERLCEDLLKTVEQIVEMDSDGKLVYKNSNAQQIARMRNKLEIMGLLLLSVFGEGDEVYEEIRDAYEMKDKTIKRYSKILFGANGLEEITK